MMCNFVNLQCKNHSVEYASMYKFMTRTLDGALAVFTQADLTISYMYTTCFPIPKTMLQFLCTSLCLILLDYLQRIPSRVDPQIQPHYILEKPEIIIFIIHCLFSWYLA